MNQHVRSSRSWSAEIVALAGQKVALTMLGETVEAPLERRLKAVTWVGCCLTSVTSNFSPIDVTGK